MANFGKFTAFVLLFICSIALYAFTASYLWGLFLVPLGLPVISGVHAYGIAIFVSLLQVKNTTKFKPEFVKSKSVGETFGVHIAFSLVSLLMGYCLSLFM